MTKAKKTYLPPAALGLDFSAESVLRMSAAESYSVKDNSDLTWDHLDW